MFKIKWRKISQFISLVTALVFIITACGNPVADTKGGPATAGISGGSNTVSAPSGASGESPKDTFVVSENIGSIETLVANPFISPGIPFAKYMWDSLFEYAPFPKDTYIPLIGESFEEKGNDLIVKLKKGVKWSDGKPFTSKDVISSYNLAFITNNVIWNYLGKIEAPDENTVVFTWRKQGPMLKQMAFEVLINAPYSVYGKWSDQATPLIAKLDASGKLDKDTDDQRIKVREDLFTFKPKITDAVCVSAYKVDNTTSSEVLLKKRSDSWCASNVKFEKLIVMRYTTLDAYVPNAITGKYDGEQHGSPPDVFEQIKKAQADMKLFWVPRGSQPAMFFNTSKYPVNDVRVRKAIAYAINLKDIQPVLEPGTLDNDPYLCGMVPSFRELWVSKDATSKMQNYSYNRKKAEDLLTEAGWKKGSDGFYRDDKGQLVQIEFASMNNWPIFFLGGDAIVNQMNQFGIKSQFKAMEFAAYNDYLKAGQHTIGFQFLGNIAYGHGWGAYKHLYKDNVVWVGLKDPKDNSAAYPDFKVKIGTGETVDVYKLIDEVFYTNEKNDQIKIIDKLALATNEFVPFYPIGEKTTPFKVYHTRTKLTGYPEDPKDPIWFGGSSTDSFSKLLKLGKMDVKK